ncbi:MAG: hypothetical protein ACR2QF_00380 [Geminicoccaceae bacterium]
MAKQNSGDEGRDVTKDHNVADLKQLIRDCCQSMCSIKAQRQELNDQAGDIRKRLKEAGVTTKAFEFSVRVYEMEGEARGNYIDWLKVCFEALGVGEQGMLFPDSEAATEAEATTG